MPNEFCALDGEAIENQYCMLCNSAGDCLSTHGALETETILDWLYDLGKPHARNRPILVGFAFNYDVNMILRNLDWPTLRTLWTESECIWGRWAIQYRPRKEFAIRPKVRHPSERTKWVRVWDTFGFFQSSFVKALERWNIGSPDMIARMKGERADFGWHQFAEIKRYCFAECEALAELIGQLRTAASTAGVKLTRWDGAGAIAARLLAMHKIKQYHAPRPARNATIRAGENAARHAYYGGRIECIRWGDHQGPIYAYDLRSAYPAALATLPCMACGSWERSTETTVDPWQVHHVQWSLDGIALPFPWRARDGHIAYCRIGRGWYWECELRAAQDALACGVIQGRLETIESLRYKPRCDHQPWSWIPSVYAARESFLATGNAAEKPLKLGLNSLYGKCAQRTGRDQRHPAYQQLVWASLTTAITRATLYRASWPVMDSLISYATDSVISTQPLQLPGPQPGRPGGWTADTYAGATVVMPGIYWLGDRLVRTRGWRSVELDRERIRGAWQARQTTIQLSARRFIGLGAALMRRDPGAFWRQWLDMPRTLAIHPIGPKRMLAHGARWNRLHPWERLIDTIPSDITRWQLKGMDSTPLQFANWQRDNTASLAWLGMLE